MPYNACRLLADGGARCDQFVIGTPLGHEFFMCALFYDNSLRHHCYDVSSLNGGQSVSNDYTGASFSGLIQSSLDSLQENRFLL